MLANTVLWTVTAQEVSLDVCNGEVALEHGFSSCDYYSSWQTSHAKFHEDDDTKSRTVAEYSFSQLRDTKWD